MPVDTVIYNCKVVTPSGLIEGGLAIEDGVIVKIAKSANLPESSQRIDAKGKYALPGAVDAHVHQYDPWEAPDEPLVRKREDFASGTMAAACGGTTTIIDMPDTVPLVTNAQVFKAKIANCEPKAYIDFGLHGGFTPQSDFEKDIPELWQAGATGLKTFTCLMPVSAPTETFGGVAWPPISDGELVEAINVAAKLRALVMIHAENEQLLNYNYARLMRENRTDYAAHLEWRPPIVEIETDFRSIFYLKQLGARGMLVHTSVPEGVLEARRARLEGHEIYVETCPQYLYLTEEDVRKQGPWRKCAPPVRDKARAAQMWELLNDGFISSVGSDHSPFTNEEAESGVSNIWNALNGLPGIETLLPTMINGVSLGRITMQRLVEVCSENPARIYGLYPRKGALIPGADADIVLVDMNLQHEIRNDNIRMKSGWTPYDGTVVKGYPVLTMVRGNILVQDGNVHGKPGYGQFVPRLPTIQSAN